MRADYRECVVNVLRQESRLEPGAPVTAATPLGDGGLAMTSIGLVRAFISVEDMLDIELDDAVIMGTDLRTVGDVLTLVARAAGEPG
jgi:acyl carrier protein